MGLLSGCRGRLRPEAAVPAALVPDGPSRPVVPPAKLLRNQQEDQRIGDYRTDGFRLTVGAAGVAA